MYQVLADALDKTHAMGLFPSLEVEGGTDLEPRQLAVMRNRLFLLGYLKRDSEKASLDEDLAQAVQAFLAEVGLKAGGDAASQAWQPLQELVSFETPSNLPRWGRPEREPLLQRAVHLRLFALGLIKDMPRPRDLFAGLDAALADFRTVSARLTLTAQSLDGGSLFDLAAILFDPDAMVTRLATMGEDLVVTYPTDLSRAEKKRQQGLVEAFVKGVARIELWLLGYKTAPIESPLVHYNGTRQTLKAAMPKFWSDQDAADRPPRSGQTRIGGTFFQRLCMLRDQSDDIPDRQAEEKVLDSLLQDPDAQKQTARQIKSLGARLFDGIGRAVRWLKHHFTRFFASLKTSVLNMARFLMNQTFHVATKVRDSVRAMILGLRFLSQKIFAGPASAGVAILHDRDMDFSAYLDTAAAEADLDHLVDQLLSRARLFAVAARIVALVTGVFLSIFKGVVAGWFGVLVTLAKTANTVSSLVQAAKEAGLILGQLKELLPTTAPIGA